MEMECFDTVHGPRVLIQSALSSLCVLYAGSVSSMIVLLVFTKRL